MAGESARWLRRASQILEHVPEIGRLFEIEFRSGLVHLVFNRPNHFPRMAFEKIARLRDALAIQFRADLAQPRRHLVGRRFQFAFRGRTTSKSQDPKFLPHEIERLTERSRMRVRTEVARAVVLLKSREAEARPFFGGIDFYDEKAFVVPKGNVVARTIFLDQL